MNVEFLTARRYDFYFQSLGHFFICRLWMGKIIFKLRNKILSNFEDPVWAEQNQPEVLVYFEEGLLPMQI